MIFLDFDDDDNAYEDEQQSTPERKQYSSEPAKKDRVSEVRRRGSDSEVKSSYTVAPRRHKSNNATVQRRDPQLPYIRPAQTRRAVVNPTRRPRESATSSIKTGDLDKRAASARNDKLKLMEGQVAALRRQLEDQRIENSTLRTIQRREEKAIKKYEEKEYDIHRIVRDYNQEIDHIKQVLINERETKMRLEKQMEARDEKLREQTKRLKQFEKIVHEKNLDERYELREKLNETDKKLQEYQEKLATHVSDIGELGQVHVSALWLSQEKYIENLEKNHRHEIKQELARQRDLKRELEKRSEKYNDLQLKFEDKARQIDTMHIYAQRGGKRPSDSPSNLSKSRSLQSLNDTSPRLREKMNNYDRKRPDQERKPRLKLEPPSSVDDSSSKSDKKKLTVKKDPPAPSTKQNGQIRRQLFLLEWTFFILGHGAPKGKPPTRRLSTPESIEEEKLGGDDDGTLLASKSKKAPATLSMQRDEQLLSPAQIHKRAPAPQPKYTSSGTTAGEGSSIFKLTEAPTPAVKAAPLKPRAKLDLDEKWSDMFGSSKQEDSAKEDLLSKLIADEQLERRTAATTQPSTNASQRVSMTTFEPSTRPTKGEDELHPCLLMTICSSSTSSGSLRFPVRRWFDSTDSGQHTCEWFRRHVLEQTINSSENTE